MIGTLAFTSECVLQTRRTFERTAVSETKMSGGAAAAFELSPEVPIPDAELTVFVDEVPPTLAAVVARGATVATLSISRSVTPPKR